MMIYLNNAATSFPKPEAVNRAVKEFLSNPHGSGGRSGPVTTDSAIIFEARKTIGHFLGFQCSRNVIFTAGATDSLNLALRGLDLAGFHVVSTVTEHNSVLRPLHHLKREQGTTFTLAECDSVGLVDPDEIKRCLKPETRLIVVNQCSNVTGALQDIEAIGRIAREAGVTLLVDGAQSAGLHPVCIDDWHIDLFAFTGHKGLLGLPGSGGLCVADGVTLKPWRTGGTGFHSELLFQPEEMPFLLEAGTQNLPGILSMQAGVRFIGEQGLDNLTSRKDAIVAEMIEGLKSLKGVTLHVCPSDRKTLFSFTVEGMEPEDIAYILTQSADIRVRSGLLCAPVIHEYLGTNPKGVVRVSPGAETTREEIDAFLSVMKTLNQYAED